MHKQAIGVLLFLAFIILTGFNTDNAIVPRDEILSGGPPKDGIPAILAPKFVDSDQAAYLQGSDDIIISQLHANPGVQRDLVGNHAIRIEISPAGEVVDVQDEKGRAVVSIYSYWFAWQAFHPDTEVYQP